MLEGFHTPFHPQLLTRNSAEREVTPKAFAFDSEDFSRPVLVQIAASRTFLIHAVEL